MTRFTDTTDPKIKIADKYKIGDSLHKFDFVAEDENGHEIAGRKVFVLDSDSSEYLEITRKGHLFIDEELPPHITELKFTVGVEFKADGQRDWEIFTLEEFTIPVDAKPELKVNAGDALVENAAKNKVVGTYEASDANGDPVFVRPVDDKYADIFAFRGGKIKIKDPAAFDFESFDAADPDVTLSADGKVKTISIELTARSRHDGYKTKTDTETVNIQIVDDGLPELLLTEFDVYGGETVLQHDHDMNEAIGHVRLVGVTQGDEIDYRVLMSDEKTKSDIIEIDAEGNLKTEPRADGNRKEFYDSCAGACWGRN